MITRLKTFNKLLFFCAVAILLYSCKSQSNVLKDKVTDQQRSSETVQLSSPTKIFLSKLRLELKQWKQKNTAFVPTKDLIDTYHLVQSNNLHLVKGFARFKDEYNKDLIQSIGVRIGKQFGEQTTVSVPVTVLESFLESDQLNYFEITTKAKLK